jgi:hypothetical protein
MQHVPEGNAGRLQGSNSRLVGGRRIEVQEFGEYPPEDVVRMRVILARCQDLVPGMLPRIRTSAFLSSIGSKLCIRAIPDV